MLNCQQNQELRADVFLRIIRPSEPLFEVAVFDLFENQDDVAATATVNSARHISWDGRVLNTYEHELLLSAIKSVHIAGVPNRTNNPSSTRFLLEITTPDAFGNYEWWGELPSVWSSLADLVDALRNLAIEK